MQSPKELTEFAIEYVKTQGASAVGVSTKETLEGGPPSVRSGVRAEGRPLGGHLRAATRPGQDHRLSSQGRSRRAPSRQFSHGQRCNRARRWSGQLLESTWDPLLRGLLEHGLSLWIHHGAWSDFLPDISHRYLAARSGVGWFGFSGNIITEEHGAAVLLGTTVTTAELEPTEPLPEDDKYCDECQLCLASCNSGLFDKKETTTVTMGGKDFSYSKRKSYHRCDLVCGGFTGLSKNHRWSTWSPGRFEIPETDEEFRPALIEAITGIGAAARDRGRLLPPGDGERAQAQPDLRKLPAPVPSGPRGAQSGATSCSPRAVSSCSTRTARSRPSQPKRRPEALVRDEPRAAGHVREGVTPPPAKPGASR